MSKRNFKALITLEGKCEDKWGRMSCKVLTCFLMSVCVCVYLLVFVIQYDQAKV